MNEKNVSYLENSLKFHGFGEGLKEQLKKAIESGESEFQLSHQAAFGRDKVDYSLSFKKGNEGEMYFFNSYYATLKVPEGEAKGYRVYLENKGRDITAKEVYNLLSGRAVYRPEMYNKAGEKYAAWVELDYKNKQDNDQPKMEKYHENYGYDLSKALARFPFTGQDTDEKKDMFIKSLQRGNLQAATWDLGGSESKVFISANPKFKSINAFDEHGKRLYIPEELRRGESNGVSEKPAVEEEKKNFNESKAGAS